MHEEAIELMLEDSPGGQLYRKGLGEKVAPVKCLGVVRSAGAHCTR